MSNQVHTDALSQERKERLLRLQIKRYIYKLILGIKAGIITFGKKRHYPVDLKIHILLLYFSQEIYLSATWLFSF